MRLDKNNLLEHYMHCLRTHLNLNLTLLIIETVWFETPVEMAYHRLKGIKVRSGIEHYTVERQYIQYFVY